MLRNTEFSFGWIAIIMHWLVATTVVGLFILGYWMVDLSYYDAWYQAAPDLHRSIGLCLLVVMVIRLVWRLCNPHPRPEPGLKRWEIRISAIVHLLLYLLIFTTIIAGYLISTANGRGIEIFGWFTVPAIFPAVEGMEDIAGDFHEYLAYALMALAFIHMAGALKHHFVDKDRTLRRMIKPQQ